MASSTRVPNSRNQGHANTDEMTYVLGGRVLISILDDASVFSTFVLETGQMFFVESGSLHHIENIGDGEAEILVAFRHEKPKDFSLQASFGAMSDAVLGNTYDVKATEFAKVKRDTKERHIVRRQGPPTIPEQAKFANAHKFDIEKMAPPVSADIGSAKKASSHFWPIVKNMAMYSLTVEEDGMREPHWHPKTGEMGYVHKGQARMSIMDPDGSVDTYTLKPGDVYFVPAAYPHQIEVIGDEKIHFCIFFDQPMPLDVGYRTAATSLSREVLAATFGVTESKLPQFPTTVQDPLLVGRINAVDPVAEGTTAAA